MGRGNQAPLGGALVAARRPRPSCCRTMRATGPSELPPSPQDPLQNRLPPPPRAGPHPASLRLLPWLEVDRRGARGLWGR